MNTVGFALVTGLMALLSYLLGRVFERRKNVADAEKKEAEAEGKELDNVEKAISIWRNTALDLQKKVEALNSQVISLLEQNKILLIQIGHFEKEMAKRNS